MGRNARAHRGFTPVVRLLVATFVLLVGSSCADSADRSATTSTSTMAPTSISGSSSSAPTSSGGSSLSTTTNSPAVTTSIGPRPCSNQSFAVVVPAGWYTNLAGPTIAACTAYTSHVADPSILTNGSFPWPPQLVDTSGFSIVVRAEAATPAAQFVAGAVQLSTGVRPGVIEEGSTWRLEAPVAGVNLTNTVVQGASRATRLTVQSRNAVDGTPDRAIDTYLIAETTTGGTIWSHLDPRQNPRDIDAAVTFETLIRSLRLT